MNWKKFMDEKDYQRFFARCLTERTPAEERFRLRTNADYCRNYAMDRGLLIEFLEFFSHFYILLIEIFFI